MGSCFGPIFGGCDQGPIASTGPVFNPVFGLRLGPAHLLFQTPSVAPQPFLSERRQGLYRFSDQA